MSRFFLYYSRYLENQVPFQDFHKRRSEPALRGGQKSQSIDRSAVEWSVEKPTLTKPLFLEIQSNYIIVASSSSPSKPGRQSGTSPTRIQLMLLLLLLPGNREEDIHLPSLNDRAILIWWNLMLLRLRKANQWLSDRWSTSQLTLSLMGTCRGHKRWLTWNDTHLSPRGAAIWLKHHTEPGTIVIADSVHIIDWPITGGN